MNITLKDFLDLYNFKQWLDDDKKELGTKKVRIYYDQPLGNSDENNWFEFGMCDTNSNLYIAEEIINKDILNQVVKSVTVVEYDVCNPILRIDTYVCKDVIQQDKTPNIEENVSEDKEQDNNSEIDIFQKIHDTLKSKFLTEKQIMFLKGLQNKWKYIACNDDCGSVCVFVEKPIMTEDDSLLFDDDNEYEYMDDLTDSFLFKKNEIYEIQKLINGGYDGGFALGIYGNYKTTKVKD